MNIAGASEDINLWCYARGMILKQIIKYEIKKWIFETINLYENFINGYVGNIKFQTSLFKFTSDFKFIDVGLPALS